ncbi:multicopper oxidase LPR1-like [Amaranthus tricolor]|uniref:multicopper oxidase LPR1-like n=1 Tax=Amaranthus tricolor TaxID=29722 RepID=UPI0025843C02|nr:multicopper oxidase LPR1-like [Amaranthus tricolor]
MIVVILLLLEILGCNDIEVQNEISLWSSSTQLKMFVDEVQDVPKLYGYKVVHGRLVPNSLTIGMFQITWKFHRDLPPTQVFAYGTSIKKATIPGPTIEAHYGIDTYITWQNHLPSKHILPWDRTIPTAIPPNQEGVPTVVHLHGGIDEPESDGHADAWFTNGFKQRGPHWTKKTYHYHNKQQPGNAWYHDHAMGLTRVNLLAGLAGSYIIRHPQVEDSLGLPYGDEFDKVLVVCDKDFYRNGSIFLNSTGNNPDIHPEWQPEYFGSVIIVNGKAWPYMKVERRKYRFRIINTSNARYYGFYLTNRLPFIHIGSDSAYLDRPITTNHTLLAPSEIADLIIDFSKSQSSFAVLANDAPYPFPSGNSVNDANSKVMKFIIKDKNVDDPTHIPPTLIKYPPPDLSSVSQTRYIAMYEYSGPSDRPTHLYINALSFEAPVTETPKVGSTEIWYVINLTEDNHPFHIHLGLFLVLEQTQLLDFDTFKECMVKMNDAVKCNVHLHAQGNNLAVQDYESGWKNVFKMSPFYMTKILVKFSYIHSNESYPFDATKEPGYIYHCHILEHEDNVMMRPMKLVK